MVRRVRDLPGCALWALLIGVLILVCAAPTNAYFSKFSDKKPIQAVVPHSLFQSGKTSHVLLLSSNDEVQHQFTTSDRLPPDDLVRFSYMDRLPLPETVFRPSNPATDTSLTVDNLLYANLKLSRLMDDYLQLQNRAEAVLEGLDVPFVLQHPTHVAAILPREPNITEAIDGLRSYSHTVEGLSDAWLQRTDRHRSANNPQTRRAIGQGNFSRQPLRIGRRYAATSRTPSQSGEASGDDRNVGEAEEENQPARMRYGTSDAVEIPWLVRFPMIVLNYIYHNKIESLIYFLMIYGVVHVLVTSKR